MQMWLGTVSNRYSGVEEWMESVNSSMRAGLTGDSGGGAIGGTVGRLVGESTEDAGGTSH